MQFLWTYIDDIVGKGVGLWTLIELIFYLSMSLIPTALPIAILISSVMIMGNLAERYELSSFKSAGVPLMRIMQPLLFVAFGVSIFSFICSNNLIPIANLKFKSRLYDIRKQKPMLSLEEGVFNDDFKNIVIHIGSKDKVDKASINDILIYDHNSQNKGRTSQIIAEKGEMYTTNDKKYFVMNLKNGTQYQEAVPDSKKKNHPFIRTSFREWSKVFDLSEFNLDETNPQLFKSHQSMLSTNQLIIAIDSIDNKIDNRLVSFNKIFKNYFQIIKDTTSKKPVIDAATMEKYKKYSNTPDKAIAAPKMTKEEKELAEMPKNTSKKTPKKLANRPSLSKDVELPTKLDRTKPTTSNKKTSRQAIKQVLDQELSEYDNLMQTFSAANHEQAKMFSRAKSNARSIQGQANSAVRILDREKEKRVKHVYELNLKFSMALVCIIFLFIGAPMGAIVRKGGFGYPLLIAIFFFVVFIVLTIFCKKIAESHVIPAHIASWIPCSVLLPIGFLLTYKAMNDTKMLNIDKYTAFFSRLFSKFSSSN